MKISVVGGGNAGCITALQLGWHGENEVELIYNSKINPELVGQATTLDPPGLFWSAMGFTWYNNPMHATFKSGILYEGWGKTTDKVFHDFPSDRMAMHFCPAEMQKAVLNSGHFKVVETTVEDPRDVDADLVFDCRGKPDNYDDYEELMCPTNACILGKPHWDTTEATWSRHVATPDGWTFVLPASESSPSHDYSVGYCYNSNVTTEEDAKRNFLDIFDVDITKSIKYKNYVVKNPIIDDRIILNGNRLFFLEPLEASATQTYIEWNRYFLRRIVRGQDPFGDCKGASHYIKNYISHVEKFVLWHYQFGSKYDTPFWDYGKTLDVEEKYFNHVLNFSRTSNRIDNLPPCYGGDPQGNVYGQWGPYAFKLWEDGMLGVDTK